MPVVSCQTSERLEATVAKVSFNKCPFLGGSLSCFLSNTTPLLAQLKYLFQLIFSLTLKIIYISRRFKPDVFVDCFWGLFLFVCRCCLYLFSMETLYLCIKLYVQFKLHVSWPIYSSWVDKKEKKRGYRGIQSVKLGKYHILSLNYIVYVAFDITGKCIHVCVYFLCYELTYTCTLILLVCDLSKFSVNSRFA